MKLAKIILNCIGDIDELHIAEAMADAELTDVMKTIKRKRAVKYSVAAVAVGIAAAALLIRARRGRTAKAA